MKNISYLLRFIYMDLTYIYIYRMHKLRYWIRRENIKRIPWGIILKEDNAFAKC